MSSAPGRTETAIIKPQIEERARRFGGDPAAGVQDLRREKQLGLHTSDPGEIGDVAAMRYRPWGASHQRHAHSGQRRFDRAGAAPPPVGVPQR